MRAEAYNNILRRYSVVHYFVRCPLPPTHVKDVQPTTQ